MDSAKGITARDSPSSIDISVSSQSFNLLEAQKLKGGVICKESMKLRKLDSLQVQFGPLPYWSL
jgi:hypothetical protein